MMAVKQRRARFEISQPPRKTMGLDTNAGLQKVVANRLEASKS